MCTNAIKSGLEDISTFGLSALYSGYKDLTAAPTTPTTPAAPPAPQAAKGPSVDVLAAQNLAQQSHGVSSTLLTGAAGVPDSSLNLGKSTLLGM